MGVICSSTKREKTTMNTTLDTSKIINNSCHPNEKEIPIIKARVNPAKNLHKFFPEKAVVQIDSNIIVNKGVCDPYKEYSIQKFLGTGSFGTVYLVKHVQLSKYFAMKIIKKQNKSKDEEKNIMNEIKILKQLDHPNILKINEFYSLKDEYLIITEFCKHGELFKEIKDKAPFDETIACYFMREILSAVCYCHSMNVIHRDLKPENIMIFKRKKNGYHQIKIIDLGTAKVFSKGKSENSVIGSLYYIAPEVLSRNYTEKCDLWSCGVIMYILLTGRPPFGGLSAKEIITNIESGKYDINKYPWGIISKEAKELIRNLLQFDPKKRLSAEEALRHQWFEMRKMKEIEERNDEVQERNLKKMMKNLKEYQSDNVLRCAVIAYLVHNNTELSQARDAVKFFNKIDKNGDGRIEKEELIEGLQGYLDLKGEEMVVEVESIFKNIDINHNGFIEYEEFITAAIDKEYFLKENFIRFAFNFFDLDRSGNITMNEVDEIFNHNEKNKKSKEAQSQLKRCFDEIDINKDGSISFDEFVEMMKKIINV